MVDVVRRGPVRAAFVCLSAVLLDLAIQKKVVQIRGHAGEGFDATAVDAEDLVGTDIPLAREGRFSITDAGRTRERRLAEVLASLLCNQVAAHCPAAAGE